MPFTLCRDRGTVLSELDGEFWRYLPNLTNGEQLLIQVVADVSNATEIINIDDDSEDEGQHLAPDMSSRPVTPPNFFPLPSERNQNRPNTEPIGRRSFVPNVMNDQKMAHPMSLGSRKMEASSALPLGVKNKEQQADIRRKIRTKYRQEAFSVIGKKTAACL